MLTSHNKTIVETLGRSPIHPFPARMAPGIALEALGESKTPLRVRDPMAGSGTVLAVARASGHRAFGYDLDPLAVLLAGVWTRTVDPNRVRDKAAYVLDRAKIEFASLTLGQAYPSGSDDETRKFIRYWFDDYARRQLAALSAAINRVRDEVTRDVLWCGFSRLIITKQAGASLAMDLSHSRPHKAFDYAPVKPFNRFTAAIDTVVSNCPQPGTGPVGPATVVKHGDARQLCVANSSIDLVLTSPPYWTLKEYNLGDDQLGHIADYDRTSGKFLRFLETMEGKQPGDPLKAAEAIIAAVESDSPPLRLVLGKYANDKVRKKLAAIGSELAAWEGVGSPTDFAARS